jgi:peptide/nickel transport system substrate-binding protein
MKSKWCLQAVGIGLAAVASVSLPSRLSAQEPARGGTLVEVLSADAAVISASVSLLVQDLYAGCIVYEGLIRYGKDFKIEPALAQSWDISADGKTYTFHLRKANWQDGRPFTASDVVFTLTQVAAKYGPKFSVAAKVLDSVIAKDDSTIVITLKQPFGPFLFSLSCEGNAGILPEHVFGGTDILKASAEKQPVGTGAYKFSEWIRGDRIIFTANKDYWNKGEPYLDSIVLKIIPNASARVLALRSGAVDVVPYNVFPLSSVTSIGRDKNFTLREKGNPNLELALLNHKTPTLAKKEVRQALLTAIDRVFVKRSVFQGLGNFAASSVDTRITWAYNPAVDLTKMYPFDPKKAEQMLDAAGLPRKADGSRFDLRIVYESARPEYTPLAEALQRFWRNIGVNVKIVSAERAVVLKQIFADYDFEVALWPYTTSSDPALGIARTYVTDAIDPKRTANNVSRYSNPVVDELFQKGQDASTLDERAKYYFEVQKVLADELPVLPIYESPQFEVSSNRVHGLDADPYYPWSPGLWLEGGK